jgi:hypothetical protein
MEKGVYKHACACGAEYVDTDMIGSTIGHIYDDQAVCTMCHKTEAELRLPDMELILENEYGKLYIKQWEDMVDKSQHVGAIAYYSAETGKTLFSLPYDHTAIREGGGSHISLHLDATLIEDTAPGGILHLSNDTKVAKAEVESGKLTLTYALSYSFQHLPQILLRSDMEEYVFAPLSLALGGFTTPEFEKFESFYSEVFYASTHNPSDRRALGDQYPIVAAQNVDAYVLTPDASFMERYYVEQTLRTLGKLDQSRLHQNNALFGLTAQTYEIATVTFTLELTEDGLLITYEDTLSDTIGDSVSGTFSLFSYLMGQSAPDITLAPKDPGPG